MNGKNPENYTWSSRDECEFESYEPAMLNDWIIKTSTYGTQIQMFALNIHTSIPFSDSSNESKNFENASSVKMSKFNVKNATFKGYNNDNFESLEKNLQSSQFAESKKDTKCINTKTVRTAL